MDYRSGCDFSKENHLVGTNYHFTLSEKFWVLEKISLFLELLQLFSLHLSLGDDLFSTYFIYGLHGLSIVTYFHSTESYKCITEIFFCRVISLT